MNDTNGHGEGEGEVRTWQGVVSWSKVNDTWTRCEDGGEVRTWQGIVSWSKVNDTNGHGVRVKGRYGRGKV